MIVYKFGGASVSSAEGVEKVYNIVNSCDNKLIIVVSAMGKTTNNLEAILECICNNNFKQANQLFSELVDYHHNIINSLGMNTAIIQHIVNSIKQFIDINGFADKEYEFRYDAFVSYGEMLSSTILSKYLESRNVINKLLDMRDILITDNSYKEANVDFIATSTRVMRAISLGFNTYVVQGFVGGTADGHTTTLGREGSDYTAAIIGNVLMSDNVTIWKDVDGVYNADPKEFNNVELLDQIPYAYAVELAFSGAQIIHPKTIKPLENKNIPLFVKPFNNPQGNGTVINSQKRIITTPIFIKKKMQNLVSVHPKDLSFVLERSMEDVMSRFNQHKHKINLIQTSAVSISISTNESRHFDALIEQLQESYVVSFNRGLELLTIKNYTPETLKREREGYKIYIEQKTRSGVVILRGDKNE